MTPLKPTDPYPTWPFTQVDPKELDAWIRKNLPKPQPQPNDPALL